MTRPLPKRHQVPRSKPERFPKKRSMTLISGFRCDEGLAVCADSQETVTIDGNEYRVTRQKIKSVKCGNFELAIGGTSSIGPDS
jgi:hypothetical protein